MDENNFVSTGCASNCFKEAVCIDAMRVYDSCSEAQPPSCHAGGRQRSRTSKRTAPSSLRQRMEETRRRHSLFSSAGEAFASASAADRGAASRPAAGEASA